MLIRYNYQYNNNMNKLETFNNQAINALIMSNLKNIDSDSHFQ